MSLPYGYAVKVTEENLDQISELNSGVKPLVEDGTTYFVSAYDFNVPNMIVSEEYFLKTFRFATPENEQFALEIEQI